MFGYDKASKQHAYAENMTVAFLSSIVSDILTPSLHICVANINYEFICIDCFMCKFFAVVSTQHLTESRCFVALPSCARKMIDFEITCNVFTSSKDRVRAINNFYH